MHAAIEPRTLAHTLEDRLEQALHGLLMFGGGLVPVTMGLARAILDREIDTRSYPTYGPYC